MISVIIPVYNVQEYLRECIDSVINQTYEDLQIILVDDGSTDDSGKICDEYKKKDSRIIVIHKKNQGLGYARNSGLDIASGDYIFFLDSDDWILPNALFELYTLAEARTADVVCFDFFYVNNREQKDFSQFEKKIIIIDNKYDLLLKYFDGGISSTACSKLYNKSVWQGLRFTDVKLHEDAWICHLVLDKCNKAVVTNQRYYAYYQRSSSLVRKAFKKENFLCITAGERYVEFVKEKYPDLIGYAYLELFRRRLYTLDKMKRDRIVKQFKNEYKQIVKDLKNDLPCINTTDSKDKKDIVIKTKEYTCPHVFVVCKLLKWCCVFPVRVVRKILEICIGVFCNEKN